MRSRTIEKNSMCMLSMSLSQMSIYTPINLENSVNPHKTTKRRGIITAGVVILCSLFFLLGRIGVSPSLRSENIQAALEEPIHGKPDRPIVGILSLTLSDAFRDAHHIHREDVKAVIPASYVRWLQSAGAQVVVVPHFWPESEIRNLVSKLSGILFTGGDYGDDAWNATTTIIFNEVIRRNGTDDPLALWATCLGYERILQIASHDNTNTVVKATVMDESLVVRWDTSRSSESPFMKFMGAETLSHFASHKIAYNFHFWGVTPDSWSVHSSSLDPLFQILGTHNKQTLEFIAMIEGRNGLPIWGVQFHPEKALFEWSPLLHYPHSEVSVLSNRKISDFFVGQVRRFSKIKTSKGFENFEDESKFAIYNYPTIFTGEDINATHSVFTETYIIN